jgi:hypothetical protein
MDCPLARGGQQVFHRVEVHSVEFGECYEIDFSMNSGADVPGNEKLLATPFAEV